MGFDINNTLMLKSHPLSV